MPSLWKITVFGIFLLFAFLFWIFIIGISANQHGSYYNKGHNAIWIEHDWVGKEKTDAEIQKLVKTLQLNQIDTVFVHSGPFASDGTVPPRLYPYASQFLDVAKKYDDTIEYQAWLGQIRSRIDLSDDEVKQNIVREVKIFTDLLGFDGIHFDIEPLWDEDLDFIETLKQSYEAISDGKKISVALAEFIPSSFLWMTERIHDYKNYNTEVNYLNTAKYCDQIAVMVYDTGINSKWLYEFLVREQAIRVTSLIKDKEIFIGIPAYEDVKDGFDPEIENIETGLRGLVSGLNNFRVHEKSFAGVAIYPYWTMTEEKWEIYKNLWVK